MPSILYEPSSIRSDYGVLYLTEGEPVILPFVFNVKFKSLSGEPINYDIEQSDVVKFVIKPIRQTTCKKKELTKEINNLIDNVGVLELTADDMKFFIGGNNYELSATLYSNISITLIKQLPIQIQKVV